MRFLQILETITRLKITRKKILSILHRLQIKQINVEKYIFQKISTCSSYQSQLKAFVIAIVTRHFRPKSGHLNDSVYCKPIDRTLKMLFIEGSDSFLPPIILEL